MTKKIIHRVINTYFDVKDYDGTSLIAYIEQLKREHNTEIFFDIKYNTYDEGHHNTIFIKAEETDEEYNQRLKYEKKFIKSVE